VDHKKNDLQGNKALLLVLRVSMPVSVQVGLVYVASRLDGIGLKKTYEFQTVGATVGKRQPQ
jgi:hypothetical protein